ncbi:MAG: glycosyltransferase family 4 protein [Thermoplasmata archaeon]
MRIVVAIHRYFPATGGSERTAQVIAEGAAHRGHEVTVVTQAETGAPAREVLNGVTVIRIGMRKFGRFRIPRGYLPVLRSLPADVFHLHGNRIWCVDYYLPWARSFSWPQVITPHGFYHYWMRRGFIRWLYYQHYFPARLRAFAAYAAHTEGERDQAVSWGYPSDQIKVIPASVDIAEFSSPPVDIPAVRAAWGLSPPRIGLFVGALFDNKRVDRLIRAVAATHGEWGLVVIGADGPTSPYDRGHCEQLAQQLGAPVRFLGPQPRAAVISAMFAADAYLQGSAFEGFGVSLLEAMAAGRPFLAFDTGAAHELSRTGAGFCVQSEGEMIERLKGSTAEFNSMGAVGRAAAREYSPDRMVDRYLAVYESIARRSGAVSEKTRGSAGNL